jgi:predicted transcriptional regulator
MMISRTPALHEVGDLQLQILEILWARGEATVHEMLAGWRGDPLPAYVTLLTVCRRLERRGLLSHTERRERPRSRPAFVYKTRITREGVQRGMIEALVTRAFGSYGALIGCANQLAEDSAQRTAHSAQRDGDGASLSRCAPCAVCCAQERSGKVDIDLSRVGRGSAGL